MVIRPAGAHDEMALLAMRNEPSVRLWSSAAGPIDEGAHSVWFQRARVDPTQVVLIAEQADGFYVGYGRLETRVYVSYAVTRQHRGKGQGQAILGALEEEAVKRHVRQLHADVHPGNGPSLGAFGAQGYEMRDIVQVVRKGLT